MHILNLPEVSQKAVETQKNLRNVQSHQTMTSSNLSEPYITALSSPWTQSCSLIFTSLAAM